MPAIKNYAKLVILRFFWRVVPVDVQATATGIL